MNNNADNHNGTVNKEPVTDMENPRKQNLEAYDASFTSQMTFDHPVAEIWPQVLNFPAWLVGYNFENLSGKPLQEGALLKASAKHYDDDVLGAHHKFIRIVRTEPHKVVVLKVFSAEGGSLGDRGYVVIDTINLVEHEGKTTVVFNASGEFPQKASLTAAQRQSVRCETDTVMNDAFERNWLALQRLVEGSR